MTAGHRVRDGVPGGIRTPDRRIRSSRSAIFTHFKVKCRDHSTSITPSIVAIFFISSRLTWYPCISCNLAWVVVPVVVSFKPAKPCDKYLMVYSAVSFRHFILGLRQLITKTQKSLRTNVGQPKTNIPSTEKVASYFVLLTGTVAGFGTAAFFSAAFFFIFSLFLGLLSPTLNPSQSELPLLYPILAIITIWSYCFDTHFQSVTQCEHVTPVGSMRSQI